MTREAHEEDIASFRGALREALAGRDGDFKADVAVAAFDQILENERKLNGPKQVVHVEDHG